MAKKPVKQQKPAPAIKIQGNPNPPKGNPPPVLP